MQEILSFESLGKDQETSWRLSLIPYTNGKFSILIMKGKGRYTDGIAYFLTPDQAKELAQALLTKANDD